MLHYSRDTVQLYGKGCHSFILAIVALQSQCSEYWTFATELVTQYYLHSDQLLPTCQIIRQFNTNISIQPV